MLLERLELRKRGATFSVCTSNVVLVQFCATRVNQILTFWRKRGQRLSSKKDRAYSMLHYGDIVKISPDVVSAPVILGDGYVSKSVFASSDASIQHSQHWLVLAIRHWD